MLFLHLCPLGPLVIRISSLQNHINSIWLFFVSNSIVGLFTSCRSIVSVIVPSLAQAADEEEEEEETAEQENEEDRDHNTQDTH